MLSRMPNCIIVALLKHEYNSRVEEQAVELLSGYDFLLEYAQHFDRLVEVVVQSLQTVQIQSLRLYKLLYELERGERERDTCKRERERERERYDHL